MSLRPQIAEQNKFFAEKKEVQEEVLANSKKDVDKENFDLEEKLSTERFLRFRCQKQLQKKEEEKMALLDELKQVKQEVKIMRNKVEEQESELDKCNQGELKRVQVQQRVHESQLLQQKKAEQEQANSEQEVQALRSKVEKQEKELVKMIEVETEKAKMHHVVLNLRSEIKLHEEQFVQKNKVEKEKVILEQKVQVLRRKVADQETEHSKLNAVEQERSMLWREVQEMKHEAEVQAKQLQIKVFHDQEVLDLRSDVKELKTELQKGQLDVQVLRSKVQEQEADLQERKKVEIEKTQLQQDIEALSSKVLQQEEDLIDLKEGELQAQVVVAEMEGKVARKDEANYKLQSEVDCLQESIVEVEANQEKRVKEADTIVEQLNRANFELKIQLDNLKEMAEDKSVQVEAGRVARRGLEAFEAKLEGRRREQVEEEVRQLEKRTGQLQQLVLDQMDQCKTFEAREDEILDLKDELAKVEGEKFKVSVVLRQMEAEFTLVREERGEMEAENKKFQEELLVKETKVQQEVMCLGSKMKEKEAELLSLKEVEQEKGEIQQEAEHLKTKVEEQKTQLLKLEKIKLGKVKGEKELEALINKVQKQEAKILKLNVDIEGQWVLIEEQKKEHQKLKEDSKVQQNIGRLKMRVKTLKNDLLKEKETNSKSLENHIKEMDALRTSTNKETEIMMTKLALLSSLEEKEATSRSACTAALAETASLRTSHLLLEGRCARLAIRLDHSGVMTVSPAARASGFDLPLSPMYSTPVVKKANSAVGLKQRSRDSTRGTLGSRKRRRSLSTSGSQGGGNEGLKRRLRFMSSGTPASLLS